MKEYKLKSVTIPSMDEITKERNRLAYKNRYRRILFSTIYSG